MNSFSKIFIVLVTAALLAVSADTRAGGPPKRSESYSTRILGRWLGPRKLIIFHRDGTYGIQRNETAPEDSKNRHWHIRGNQLWTSAPFGSGAETIVSFTDTEFVTDVDGYRTTYRRSP